MSHERTNLSSDNDEIRSLNMHNVDIDFDINLEEISKIEGAASLSIKVRNKSVADLKFSITEWKRFYTQAIKGKPAIGVPQLVDRICGTCSNAHLLCSIKAIENAYNIKPSYQTILLRKLLYYGLIIRDHALHLYIFALPDIFGKNSILDFDENDQVQHKLLEDTFAVKEVGNQLSVVTGGRSVHAPLPTVGGFLKYPNLFDLKNLKPKLLEIRPKIMDLIKIFSNSFNLELKTDILYSGLNSPDFSFIEGVIKTSNGNIIQDKDLGNHLNKTIIPYSHATGYKLDGEYLMVGALSRLNLGKENLNQKTKEAIDEYLSKFPSKNIYDNNLAQAIEILHAIDASIEIIDNLQSIEPEPIIKPDINSLGYPEFISGSNNGSNEIPNQVRDDMGIRVGIGVIEAPRGTLYHKYEIDDRGMVKKAEIVVPTGQNQILIERAIKEKVEEMVVSNSSREEIINEAEKIIRAFDPCMSCASHFLKVKWK